MQFYNGNKEHREAIKDAIIKAKGIVPIKGVLSINIYTIIVEELPEIKKALEKKFPKCVVWRDTLITTYLELVEAITITSLD